MSFLQVLSSYPALIPSILIGVLLVFWLLAIVGMLDFESIGPDWLGGGGGDDVDLPPGALLALGFDKLPFSIVVSGIVFYWWLLTMLGAALLLSWLPLPMWIGGTVLLLASLFLALPLAAMSLRPMKPLFVVHPPATEQTPIGKPCRILTLTVDENFGQAEVDLGNGTRLNLKVWATTPNPLTRGSGALIIDFDPRRDRYLVEQYDVREEPD